jgi:hypothetical protein
MSVFITAGLFLLGVLVAIVSAELVLNEKKSWLWYALPSVYCLLVGTASAYASARKVDFAAVVFFSVILTVVGWGTVKFQLRGVEL